MIHKTLHRKLKTDQYEPPLKTMNYAHIGVLLNFNNDLSTLKPKEICCCL
jgi:hypothetical protein